MTWKNHGILLRKNGVAEVSRNMQSLVNMLAPIFESEKMCGNVLFFSRDDMLLQRCEWYLTLIKAESSTLSNIEKEEGMSNGKGHTKFRNIDNILLYNVAPPLREQSPWVPFSYLNLNLVKKRGENKWKFVVSICESLKLNLSCSTINQLKAILTDVHQNSES